ncbi:PE-PPE domain-containing protein, partial [Streptomyces sp. SID10244]|nr:PE-PPE domain-containing protein [Streptomyces sp. SID10244]
IGFYDAPDGRYYAPPITTVDYPAAFGLKVFGLQIDLAGVGTFNDSVDAGTATGVEDAYAAWQKQGRQGTVIVNGYSQSGPVAMNIAYELHKDYVGGVDGAIPDQNVVVVVGADSRFPHTGVENVVPSFMDGMYTNGDRDPADTGD